VLAPGVDEAIEVLDEHETPSRRPGGHLARPANMKSIRSKSTGSGWRLSSHGQQADGLAVPCRLGPVLGLEPLMKRVDRGLVVRILGRPCAAFVLRALPTSPPDLIDLASEQQSEPSGRAALFFSDLSRSRSRSRSRLAGGILRNPHEGVFLDVRPCGLLRGRPPRFPNLLVIA
jgi:hypothetical protein